jgi:O-antigen ligase
VIAISAGLMVMFRLQVGRIALLGIVVLIAYSIVSLFLESPGAAVAERLASGEDTRTALWLQAIQTFLESPLFGELMFLRPGDEQNGVESSLFRSLANMGIIGGIALLTPAVAAISYGLQGTYLARERPEFKRLVDFYLGALVAVLVLNTFDGYAFGLLTFPAVFAYYLFALGAFLSERAKDELELEPSLDASLAASY